VRPQRQAAILELVRSSRVSSQEVLRELLAERGIEVAQATLSRDIRELGLVKVPDEEGGSVYTVPPHVTDPTPTLSRLLPTLYLGADGVGNLLVVKTLTGGAQPIAVAIDWEEWPEVVGSVAGDDTILLILRRPDQMPVVTARLEALAGLA
jgi:transcriptional regulator of arginine metabolism